MTKTEYISTSSLQGLTKQQLQKRIVSFFGFFFSTGMLGSVLGVMGYLPLFDGYSTFIFFVACFLFVDLVIKAIRMMNIENKTPILSNKKYLLLLYGISFLFLLLSYLSCFITMTYDMTNRVHFFHIPLFVLIMLPLVIIYGLFIERKYIKPLRLAKVQSN